MNLIQDTLACFRSLAIATSIPTSLPRFTRQTLSLLPRIHFLGLGLVALHRKNQTIHLGKSNPLELGGVLRYLANDLHVKQEPSLKCGYFFQKKRLQGTK